MRFKNLILYLIYTFGIKSLSVTSYNFLCQPKLSEKIISYKKNKKEGN